MCGGVGEGGCQDEDLGCCCTDRAFLGVIFPEEEMLVYIRYVKRSRAKRCLHICNTSAHPLMKAKIQESH